MASLCGHVLDEWVCTAHTHPVVVSTGPRIHRQYLHDCCCLVSTTVFTVHFLLVSMQAAAAGQAWTPPQAAGTMAGTVAGTATPCPCATAPGPAATSPSAMTTHWWTFYHRWGRGL